MNLADLGLTAEQQDLAAQILQPGQVLGRVIAEHKERYLVHTEEADHLETEVTGQLRFSAESRSDFPAVGDWVVLTVHDQLGIIHAILPRHSLLKRRAVGQTGEVQVIAANLDFAFIIQALGRDINFNRLERYLTICYDADIQPIVIVTKTDLWPSAEVDEIIIQMKKRVPNIAIIPVSNVTQSGLAEIKKTIIPGKTYAFLGSSGVGKSSLINNLLGIPLMATQEVSTSTSKGKHRTTHRELHVLSDGGILIDNPGMREVGLTDTNQGLELTFEEIKLLAVDCRYKDCTHVHEQGCAVIRAVEEGRLEAGIYSNYIKMYKETAFFESSALEKRRREKEAGKMMKNYKKDIQRNNFLKP